MTCHIAPFNRLAVSERGEECGALWIGIFLRVTGDFLQYNTFALFAE